MNVSSCRARSGWALLATLVLVVALMAPSAASAAPRVDPLLSQALSALDPGEQVQAIVTLSSRPTLLDLGLLASTGVRTLPLKVLPMVAIQGTPLQVKAVTLLSSTRLVSVYLNRPLQYFLDGSVDTIGARRTWNELGVTGAGVGVAVLDSGVDATHPDLSLGSKVVQNVKVLGNPLGSAPGTPLVLENLATSDTTSGHGTHCASTIGGSGDGAGGRFTGVAPGAHLVGVGAGELIVILSALEGFDWVLANQTRYNIRVVSNSWGTTGAFDPQDPINVASKLAHDRGITVVFAAGNEGPGDDTLNPYSVAPWVIGVAAGAKDGSTLADFSSRGVPGDSLYHPTITAPGVGIVAARSKTGVITALAASEDAALGLDAVNYTHMSGTSMATPHVAGVVALLLQANPTLSPDQVKQVLIDTASPMNYSLHEVGAGYIDAYAAVDQVN
jgi:serine protease AprX